MYGSSSGVFYSALQIMIGIKSLTTQRLVSAQQRYMIFLHFLDTCEKRSFLQTCLTRKHEDLFHFTKRLQKGDQLSILMENKSSHSMWGIISLLANFFACLLPKILNENFLKLFVKNWTPGHYCSRSKKYMYTFDQP